MKHLLILIIISFLVSCVASKPEEKSTPGNISASAPYLWSDYPGAKNLQFSVDFSDDELGNVTDMSNAWTTALENKKTFFNNSTTRIVDKSNTVANMDLLYDSILGVYRTTNWPSTLPGSALAVTQIFGRRYNIGTSSEYVSIEHADILINFNLYPFDTDDTGFGYDLRTVVLHELGHFIGLSHKSTSSDRNASVMFPRINSSEAKRYPTSVDKVDLASKYGITLTGGGGGAGAIAGERPDYSPRVPGEEVRVLLELHADGDCVHKENGVVVGRHPANLKNYK